MIMKTNASRMCARAVAALLVTSFPLLTRLSLTTFPFQGGISNIPAQVCKKLSNDFVDNRSMM